MRKLVLFGLATLVAWFAADSARGADLRIPSSGVAAGRPLTIGTDGQGDAVISLLGPGQVIQRKVKLGSEVQIKAEDLHSAGRWIAILRASGESHSRVFWVEPAQPENLSFLARPSEYRWPSTMRLAERFFFSIDFRISCFDRHP